MKALCLLVDVPCWDVSPTRLDFKNWLDVFHGRGSLSVWGKHRLVGT